MKPMVTTALAVVVLAAVVAIYFVDWAKEAPEPQPTKEPVVATNPVETNQSVPADTGVVPTPAENGESAIREDVKHIDNFGDVGPSDKPEDNMVQRPAMPPKDFQDPQVKEPEVTPQRRSIDEMMKVFGQMVTASSFCSTPFLNDGRKVEETLDNVQAKFDEIAGSGMVMKLTAFDSHDAATLADSPNALLKKMAENTRFAKVLEHAKAAGGHFGLLSFAPDVEGKEIKPEHLVLAFDKAGKLIGMAD